MIFFFRKIIMIDIVEVASIVVSVRVPAPTLNQHNNLGSIATTRVLVL